MPRGERRRQDDGDPGALGLLRGARGEIRVLGSEAPRRLAEVIDDVGAIVEQPSFFGNFSGRQNLELLAQSRGLPVNRVDDVLETVGLGERADSRFATYSLGMKQRLAMASTLLKDPALLIFDEPANGLDPAGMLEVRTLMRGSRTRAARSSFPVTSSARSSTRATEWQSLPAVAVSPKGAWMSCCGARPAVTE